jgi:LmbE family N-acetylglucosaminyl deacetylase
VNRAMKQWSLIFLAALPAGVAAMGWAAPVAAQALPETVEAINKARIVTRILFITAHPDDEMSSLLPYLSRGLSADVALLTITRGEGGQNAIGPEQDGQLGTIRTAELLAAGRHYGVHQYFTRAVDTGFSKSAAQTMKIWGDLPLEDMVRVIRTYRPQVVINGWGGVHAGHGQHQASGILTPRAVQAAADPKAFPEQRSEGLLPWKVTLELRFAAGTLLGTPPPAPPGNAVGLSVDDVSPLWGESYTEIGTEGHAEHRSQGTPAFFGNAFFRRPVYLVRENDEGRDAGAFDVRLLAEPIASLAGRFSELDAQIRPAVASTERDLLAAGKFALQLDRVATAKSLAAAGKEIAGLEASLRTANDGEAAAARWEINRVHERIDRALATDIALPVRTQADRHELVAGEGFSVDVLFTGKPAVPVEWTLDKSSLILPSGWNATPGESKADSGRSRFHVLIPPGATVPSSPGDRILPFPPALVRLSLGVSFEGYEFRLEKPVESIAATTRGLETYPLELVPAVTLTVEPPEIMVPEKNAQAPVKLLARVRYHGAKPARVSVGLDAPPGWQAQALRPLDFSAAGDQLTPCAVVPPAQVAPGAYRLHPYAQIGGETFRTSLEPIPTLPTRDWSEPDDASVHVLDLVVPATLEVGYIAAENDPLPETLRQIGVQVDLLDEVALAFGDLSRFDAVVVGIRAYELRPDLTRMNWRLLNYVADGGTLVVQYQRDFAWNRLLPAPFSAKMADQASRVTDSDSPVRFLVPDSPLLNSPNKISLADFQGWVQERGLYFWSTFDSRYRRALGLSDFGEPEVTGGLVYARDGKGVYIYTGLSFFRQLPAGVPGAYRLFINLLSQTLHARQHE